jgi:glycosyltransferase involved in cell wall biosynthesis
MDYLARVLQGLKEQDLPCSEWELLLIDNASRVPLAGTSDLSWHPHARCIVETEIGLTPARLRGIKESKGELLVFVDDDNVLAADYLKTTLALAQTYPHVGAWSGHIAPEFEIIPPEWSKRFWSYLALHPIEKSYWANITTDLSLPPCGAGLSVRRQVAEAYATDVTGNAQRRAVDRKGQSLNSCGDTDLALTSCDLGLGYGKFVELRMIHLIPKERLSEAYLLRLEEGIAFSAAMLNARRNGVLPSPPSSALRRCLGSIRRWLTLGRLDRLVLEARLRGCHRACAAINKPGKRLPGQAEECV